MSLLLIVVAAIVAGVSGYPKGAPKLPMPMMMNSMCTAGNIRPNHLSNGQAIMPMSGCAPFTLTVDNPNRPYGPGRPVRVTLKANPGKVFKGFYITADAEDAKTGIEGSFRPTNPSMAHTSQFCVKGITHSNNDNKTFVTVIYDPPTNFTHGRMQFKATVVENFSTFYTGVLSQAINPVNNVDKHSDYMTKKMTSMMSGNGGAGGMFGGLNIGEMMKKMSGMMPGMQQGQMGQMGQTGGMPNMGGMAQGGMGMRTGGMPSMGQGGMPGLGSFFNVQG